MPVEFGQSRITLWRSKRFVYSGDCALIAAPRNNPIARLDICRRNAPDRSSKNERSRCGIGYEIEGISHDVSFGYPLSHAYFREFLNLNTTALILSSGPALIDPAGNTIKININ